MNNPAIAYILAEFPSYTETFILKEALYIHKVFPLYIIALRKGKTATTKSGYAELKDYVIYITPFLLIKSAGSYLFSLLKGKYTLYDWKNKIDREDIHGFHQIKLLLTGLCVWRLIKQKSIVHMHAHFANYPTDIAMMVSAFSGIPFSFSAHAHDIYVNPQRLTQKISQSKFVATCTLYNKKWLNNLVPASDKSKIQLLYHGVDLEHWPCHSFSNGRKQQQILFIGRLVEKKGISYLLKAIEQLKKEKHDVHLIIVGKGKDEQQLKDFCRSHELSDIVTFLGWQNPRQINDLFACSTVFVLPSIVASDGDRDGIPNVILEAMASGLPVISTPVSGITEVIRHQYNGLLVPERDVRQLADSIRFLLNDKVLRRSLCTNGLRTITEKFDSNKCNLLLRNLFENQS